MYSYLLRGALLVVMFLFCVEKLPACGASARIICTGAFLPYRKPTYLVGLAPVSPPWFQSSPLETAWVFIYKFNPLPLKSQGWVSSRPELH